MNIYMDDNLAEDQLIKLLVKGGHAAIGPADVGMAGKSKSGISLTDSYIVLNHWR